MKKLNLADIKSDRHKPEKVQSVSKIQETSGISTRPHEIIREGSLDLRVSHVSSHNNLLSIGIYSNSSSARQLQTLHMGE